MTKTQINERLQDLLKNKDKWWSRLSINLLNQSNAREGRGRSLRTAVVCEGERVGRG
jgi:hypothetical protein